MTTRKELVDALRERYRSAAFGDRIKILDELVALTGYHRKHANRVLREEVATAKAARARNRLYDEAVGQALTVLWEAADRVCGKRLGGTGCPIATFSDRSPVRSWSGPDAAVPLRLQKFVLDHVPPLRDQFASRSIDFAGVMMCALETASCLNWLPALSTVAFRHEVSQVSWHREQLNRRRGYHRGVWAKFRGPPRRSEGGTHQSPQRAYL